MAQRSDITTIIKFSNDSSVLCSYIENPNITKNIPNTTTSIKNNKKLIMIYFKKLVSILDKGKKLNEYKFLRMQSILFHDIQNIDHVSTVSKILLFEL